MSVSFMLLECRELNIDFYKSDSWDFEEKLSWNFSQYVYVQVSQLGSDDKEQHSVGEGHVPSPHIQPQVPRGVVMGGHQQRITVPADQLFCVGP